MAGDRDVDSTKGGGGRGGVPRSAYFVQLPYMRSGPHQEKLYLFGIPYPNIGGNTVYVDNILNDFGFIHGRTL